MNAEDLFKTCDISKRRYCKRYSERRYTYNCMSLINILNISSSVKVDKWETNVEKVFGGT